MRLMAAALVLTLATACSSGTTDETSSSGAASSSPKASPASESPAPAAGDDVCDLLTAADVREVRASVTGAPAERLAVGIPSCRWTGSDGAYVQAFNTPASTWSRALPDAIRQFEASGLISSDNPAMKRLKEGAQLVEDKGLLGDKQACAMFSKMVELQGQPAGSRHIVTVVPDQKNPQGVSGQICSAGRFTSVLVADTGGLGKPLPVQAVLDAARKAHGRATG